MKPSTDIFDLSETLVKRTSDLKQEAAEYARKLLGVLGQLEELNEQVPKQDKIQDLLTNLLNPSVIDKSTGTNVALWDL